MEEAKERMGELVELMGMIGANDMGWIPLQLAVKFHKAAEAVRKIDNWMADREANG